MRKEVQLSDNWGKKNIEYLKNSPTFTEERQMRLVENGEEHYDPDTYARNIMQGLTHDKRPITYSAGTVLKL